MKFPGNFLWGAATSSHQVEGGNRNDWSEWEKRNAKRLAEKAKKYWQFWQQGMFPEMLQEENYISHKACDHYNLYEKDFDLMKFLGMSAYRFSIEWSRIEPEEGKFNEKEIEHYRKVIKALRERGLEPFVTLWHFTNPVWFAEKGGWKSSQAPYYFSRYVEKIVKAFKNEIKFWITLNEPLNFVGQSYLTGGWPPQEKNLISCFLVTQNLIRAHEEAFKVIKGLNKGARVGIASINNCFEAYKNKLVNRLISKFMNWLTNLYFIDQISQYQDFIGLNYYHRALLDLWMVKNENKIVSDLGWELYPKGIYCTLMDLKKYKKPVYITENGLADANDENRAWYVKSILFNVHKAVAEGVDVRGYFYWSLLDNFEWDKGFWPRFGLVEVNYKNMRRRVRQSAREYAKIVRENGIEVDSQISR